MQISLTIDRQAVAAPKAEAPPWLLYEEDQQGTTM